MLVALWLLSLLLSGGALAIMAGLIVARWFSAIRARNREAERRRLVPLLLGAGYSRESLDDAKPAGNLLTDLVIELIQMVRGDDKENFVASASRLGVPQRLLRRLDHGSPRVRLSAAEALGDFDDEQSIARLGLALSDQNADVRLAAAIALTAGGRAPPARQLVDQLGIGTRENSMLIVGLFQEIASYAPEQIRALVEDEGVNAFARASAVDALATSGDYSLVPVIAGLVLSSHPEAEELPRYLRALGSLGHPAAANAVEHALRNPLPSVRAAAAEAAGRIGLDSMADRLAALLDDPDWWVRFRTGEALMRVGERGRLLLSQAAGGNIERARKAASLTLAERGLAP